MEANGGPRRNGRTMPDPEAVTLSDVLRAVRRQRWWIVGTVVTALAVTAAVTFIQSPVYRASTTLRVEEQQTTAVPVLDVLSELARGAKVETEMQILRSRRVAEGVVEDLALHSAVESPTGVPRDSLFDIFHVAADAAAAAYRVERGADGFVVRGPAGTRAEAYGTTVALGPLTLAPRRPAAGRDVLAIEVRRFAEAVAELQESLDVLRPEREASIIEVAYESTDPVLARDVVNAVTRHFLALRNDMQKRRASAAVGFLREQVDKVEAQLALAEAELEDFRQENLVLQVDAQVNEDVRRLAELQVQQNELEVERDAVRRIMNDLEAGRGRSWAELASYPAFVKNQAATGILEQLARLEAERSRQLATRTDDSPEVQSIERTMELLETRLATLLGSYLRTLDDRAASLGGALARFSDELEKVPAVEVRYARLKRSTDVLGELYTFLQTRLKEAEISEAVEVANVQVVDPAVVPIEPVKPRELLNLILGLLLGLGAAAGLTVARESLDTRLRSRDELAEVTGLPVLAMVPRIPGSNGRSRGRAARIESRLVTHHNPQSPAAEAYRILRTGLIFAGSDGAEPARTLVFTSPEPRDGKSTTAVNTAIALAEQGHSVLLVECDLRRPVFHEVFDIPPTPGLLDVLHGEVDLEGAAHTIPLPEHVEGAVYVVPAGGSPPNPAEIVGSSQMRAFLERAEERFDNVLLDTPPLNIVTDAAVLGSLTDGVVLVAREGSTRRETLRLACGELKRVRARAVGAVLNDLGAGGDDYHYRYGYRRYYGREEKSV